MKAAGFRSFGIKLLFILIAGTAMGSCTPESGPERGHVSRSVIESKLNGAAASTTFSDIAQSAGLKFEHYSGATEEYFFPEIMGSGGAMFDFDNDGDLDIYLVQSGRLNNTATLIYPLPDESLKNRLFENQLIPEGHLTFTDVTDAANVGDTGYGMGVAVGDADNNGFQDLFITNVGANVWLLNQGDGSFVAGAYEVTPDKDVWSTSASFLDANQDGKLDLFVTQYVHVDQEVSIHCSGRGGSRDYCTPDIYRPAADLLLIGNGEGGLTENHDWQYTRTTPKTGLGVVAADYNGDGFTDLYVANDKKANLLWLNRGDGTFEESAVMNGAAYNSNGKEEASMGVTSADFDSDGDEDLFMTHLKGETNTLYVNNGNAMFMDSTINLRLSSSSLPSTGFGTRWFDMDNDGDLDLFTANGAVMQEASQTEETPYPYNQHNQIFENQGTATYVDVSAAAGIQNSALHVSRGAAFGDIDNDGDIDILVTNNNASAELLVNQRADDFNWLTVRLRSDGFNRDGIGSRVGIERHDGTLVWRRVGTDGSYLSASDLRTHFGLGSDSAINSVQVNWHTGERERFAVGAINQHLTLIKGEGKPVQ